MGQHCTHTFRKVISTYNWKNNSQIRTYWLQCKSCNHRWKVYFDRSLQREVNVEKNPARMWQVSKPLEKADAPTVNCRDCNHWWQGECGLGVPEAGGGFAAECSCFDGEVPCA